MSNKILHLSIGILIGAALVGGYTITRLDSMKESLASEIEEKYCGYDTETIVNEVIENIGSDIEEEVSSQIADVQGDLEWYVCDVIEQELAKE